MPFSAARRTTATLGAGALVTAGLVSAGLGLAPAAQAGPATPTPDCSAKTTCTITYGYTGAAQTFTVPAGVTSLSAVVTGAAGGDNGTAGRGGVTSATVPVSPGDVLTVVAGQRGSVGDTTGTFGGGGPVTNSARGSTSASGGGGSFVFDTNGPVLAAGGGGGFSGLPGQGGPGGGDVGGGGVGYPDPGFYYYTGATGGTQTAGGTGGTFAIDRQSFSTTPGTDGTGPATGPGSVGRGGTGGHDTNTGFYKEGGGGGGGGYYGGGAGSFYQGGGGGSGYLAPEVDGTTTAGVNAGAGSVKFTWDNATTTTTLTADPTDGAKTITQVTLTATVESDVDGSGTPTGTVAFTDGAATITGCGSVSLAGGQATCSTTFAEGAHSFTAAYSGSSDHAPSASDALSYSVAGAPTFSTPSFAAGTVGVQYSQTVVTTGGTKPYTFAVTSGALPNGLELDAETGAIAGTPTTADSEPGTFTVSVTDKDELVRTKDYSIAIGKGSQTLSFTLDPETPEVGTTYDITDLEQGGGTADAVLAGNDHCSVDGTTVSFTSAGTCTVTASQDGDDNYTAATSVSHEVTVVKQASSVSLTPTATDLVYGQAVSADVEVSGPGTVTVYADDDVVDTYTVEAGDELSDTLTFQLDPGTYEIRGVFAPADAVTYAGSSSETTTVTVGAADTTTAVTVLPASLKATVTADDPSTATPSGTVQFAVGGVNVGNPVTLDDNGEATLDYTVPAADRQEVSAVYTSDDTTKYSGSSDSTARTNPTVTASVTSATPKSKYGWYRGPVTITYTCTATSAAVVACPKPVTVQASGVRTVTRTVSAEDGGVTTSTVSVRIDRGAPRVWIKGAPAGATYTKVPTVTCVAFENYSGNYSGLAGCTLTRTVTATAKPGVRHVTWTAVATDKAGNVTRATKTIRLVK